ncbi:MAG TPA: BatD family protein, partial [Verrucomicrobiae bacterium]|nr:BatD family protein [Verrucomicrobiae bacterium]
GEVIQARLELCLREDVLNIQNVQLLPIPAEGFTVGKTQEGQRTQTRAGGANYTVIPVIMLFTAVKTGSLTLGPSTCNLDLLFGPVDFFGRPSNARHVSLTSDPVTLQSIPLPADNKPSGFSGAVGNYTMSVSAAPTNIAAGDPVTVTIQIAGTGAVESLALPEQTGWQQFKLYPPTSDYQSGDQLDLSGTKTFKLTAVPESMDVKELPPFTFSFFDPEQNAYRTLTQPAMPLIVRPSAASLPPPIMATANTTSDNPPAKQDIVHIKPWLGTVARLGPPLLARPWFLGLQSVPVLAWLCLLVQRKKQDHLAANPRLRRQRQVERILRDGLNDLRQYAAANESAEFFATLFHLLQERLGERLDLPASAITEAVLDERLLPLGVPDPTIDRLRELFHICNQARYAPETSTEELASLIPQVEAALDELKNLKP